MRSQHDLEGYFENLAEQGFQNNPFFRNADPTNSAAPHNVLHLIRLERCVMPVG